MRRQSWIKAIGAFLATIIVLAGPADAFERTPLSNALLEEAVATGRPYIVYVHACWCTTCQAQDRVLETLETDERFANLLILTVDYDTKRNLMMRYNIPDRSIFVAFAGTTEIGRSVYETTPEGIAAFLQFAVDGSPNYVPPAVAPAEPVPRLPAAAYAC